LKERDMKRTRQAARKASTSIHDEISKITNDLASLGSALGENASAEAKATIRSLRQRVDSLADSASSLTEEVVEDVEKTIAENPFIAIGAAFGLGVLLSALLLRR
jgi:ElaB/YqjD/DUF883 family membrane-anchored ribosome-binding protein